MMVQGRTNERLGLALLPKEGRGRSRRSSHDIGGRGGFEPLHFHAPNLLVFLVCPIPLPLIPLFHPFLLLHTIYERIAFHPSSDTHVSENQRKKKNQASATRPRMIGLGNRPEA